MGKKNTRPQKKKRVVILPFVFGILVIFLIGLVCVAKNFKVRASNDTCGLEIKYELIKQEDFESLPKITLEDIYSGRLTACERKAVKDGSLSKMSKKAFLSQGFRVGQGKRADSLFFNNQVWDYQYYVDKDKRPVRGVSVSVVNLPKGVEALVMGVEYKNDNGTTGIVHLITTDWKEAKRQGSLIEVFSGSRIFYPVSKIKDFESSYFTDDGFGFDIRKERPIVELLYLTKADGKEKLVDKWVKDRIMPKEIERSVFLGLVGGWGDFD